MKILVVDDNLEQVQLFAKIAEKLGHIVRYTTKAGEALTIMREGFHPDIYLVDIILQNTITGSKFIDLVIESGVSVPIVAITGLSERPADLPLNIPLLFKPLDAELILDALEDQYKAYKEKERV